MEATFDREFMEYVVNRLLPFPVLMKQVNGGRYSYDRKCFCCFHNNFDTPAAKIYHNEDGDYMFCFSEQKQFRPSDVFTRKLINKRLDQVFYKLWEQLPIERQQILMESQGVEIDRIPQKWRDSKVLLEQFKLGNVNIDKHLILVVNALD